MIEIDEQAIVDKLMASGDDHKDTNDSTTTETTTTQTDDTSTVDVKPVSGGGDQPDATKSTGPSQTPNTKTDQPDGEGKPVTYKRFRQIWAEAKEYERKNRDLQAQLDAAKASPPTRQSGTKQDNRDEIDDLIDEVAFGKQPQRDQDNDPIMDLRRQIQADKLEREQEKVVQDFPEVPIHFAYAAVAENPRLSLYQAAKQIAMQLGAFEEAVLQKHYAKTQGNAGKTVAKPTPDAPPDLDAKSGSRSDKGRSNAIEKNYDDLESRILKQLGI